MSELVLMHHAEPMTTSLAIAEGVEMEHKSVIQLVRKYVVELQNFGTLTFEMRKSSGQPTEFAYLNEPQSTLLLTFMRNSEIVIRFKVALVKAFFELRDNALAQIIPTRNEPLTLSHRADNQVSAGRVFGSMMRVGRTAGLSTAHQLRRAFAITLEKTGIDLLAELQITLPEEQEQPKTRLDIVAGFLADWLSESLPVPVVVCRKTDLYRAYLCWSSENDAEYMVGGEFSRRVKQSRANLQEKTVKLNEAVKREGRGITTRVWTLAGFRAKAQPGTMQAFYTESVAQFEQAVKDWEAVS